MVLQHQDALFFAKFSKPPHHSSRSWFHRLDFASAIFFSLRASRFIGLAGPNRGSLDEKAKAGRHLPSDHRLAAIGLAPRTTLFWAGNVFGSSFLAVPFTNFFMAPTGA